METIAQQIKWDFKTNGDLSIYDKKYNEIYWESSCGTWIKREYDAQQNIIYFENSNGYWSKRKFDSNGNRIYSENSNVEIVDKRPKGI